MVAEIRQIHEESRRAYGAPRITAALRRRGRRINRKRVERLMREHDIRGITRRKRRNLTKPRQKSGTVAGPGGTRLHRHRTGHEAGLRHHLSADAGRLVVSKACPVTAGHGEMILVWLV
ncbi:IS3 family transposase [Streptomyces sp. NPDC058728]|uniref:IS3 family transposase n=1 Tax=Streptomyces sp. NPDC058728 TaxID=3346612 RepID=UPI0036A2EE0E